MREYLEITQASHLVHKSISHWREHKNHSLASERTLTWVPALKNSKLIGFLPAPTPHHPFGWTSATAQYINMATEHGFPKDSSTKPANTANKCHLLALPAELRLIIYDHHFDSCIATSTNNNGAALLEVSRSIRSEAIPECEKHLKARLTILSERFASNTERYLAVRARWVMGTHPIFLSGMILIRENLEQISLERCGLLKLQRRIREVCEGEKADDGFSLRVLEEKGNGGDCVGLRSCGYRSRTRFNSSAIRDSA